MCVPITLRLMGVTLRNFTRHEAGVIMWVQLLKGLPPSKFARSKNVQNWVQFLTTFDFEASANNSGIDRHNKNLNSI